MGLKHATNNQCKYHTINSRHKRFTYERFAWLHYEEIGQLMIKFTGLLSQPLSSQVLSVFPVCWLTKNNLERKKLALKNTLRKSLNKAELRTFWEKSNTTHTHVLTRYPSLCSTMTLVFLQMESGLILERYQWIGIVGCTQPIMGWVENMWQYTCCMTSMIYRSCTWVGILWWDGLKR